MIFFKFTKAYQQGRRNGQTNLGRMAPELRSKTEKKRAETKEDVEHLLEEIFDFRPDKTFYKIFARQTSHGIQHITIRSKEDLEKLEWKEDNVDVSKLEPFEVSMIRSLKNYLSCLKVKGNFPSNPRDLRNNTITIED